jgi:acetoin utilization protein AcuC
LLIAGERLARYGFGDGHPFGPDRHAAFLAELVARGLDKRVQIMETRAATREELQSFHTPQYLDLVADRSRTGDGYLDGGDTPAWRGVYETAADVVGGTLLAAEQIMLGHARRAFIPIAGLHHAARGGAAGFCVFNDCGVAVEMLRRKYGLKRIAYVDIDAHHGDGVYYGFEDDPDLIFADIHEDGRHLYPGTGSKDEVGRGRRLAAVEHDGVVDRGCASVVKVGRRVGETPERSGEEGAGGNGALGGRTGERGAIQKILLK